MEKNIQSKTFDLLSGSNVYNERNDCTVRALALAMGVSYADAHVICELAGRKPRKAAHSYMVIHVAMQLGYKFERVNIDRMNVRKFGETYHSGVYFVHSHNHAFNVIDGDMYNERSNRVFIVNAWKYVGKE